jgi:DNA replication and repair protein RecF
MKGHRVYLERLRLRHFRTYSRLDLALSSGVTILHGPNAAGKTNLLEAIYVLATTKSFRTRTDRDLISWTGHDEGTPRYTRFEGEARAVSGPLRVELAVAEGAPRPPMEPVIRKQFRLNNRPRRAADVVGAIKAVLFSPDDTALVTGSPSGRRRYMDLLMCQVDHHFLHDLQEYTRVVTQRNALLQRLQGRPDPATLLEFWNERLVVAGTRIVTARRTMLHMLSEFAREAYTDLAGLGEELTITYRPSLEGAAEEPEVGLAALFGRRLLQLQTKEIRQGMTLCGPHRDDLQFLVDGVDAQYFGSRGQQRSVALALRLAEMRYMTNRSGEQPILLLDEALAELDEDRRRLLLRLIEAHPQVLVTTSNLAAYPEEVQDRATLLHVRDGEVALQHPARARAG